MLSHIYIGMTNLNYYQTSKKYASHGWTSLKYIFKYILPKMHHTFNYQASAYLTKRQANMPTYT
jgi:hypothetical protein